MNNKLKPKLMECVNKIKSTEGIESKSHEEIFKLLKHELSSSLKLTPEKWNSLNEHKLLKFDLSGMSVEEETLDSMTKKMASKIKSQKQQEQSAEKTTSIKLVLTINNSFKNKITSMDREQGFETVKNEIIAQASRQGISLDMLEKPCSMLKNENSKLQLNMPSDTEFLKAITYVTYTDIMGKDAFENEKVDENDRPHYKEQSTVEEMMDDLLGVNDTKIKKEGSDASMQGPSM